MRRILVVDDDPHIGLAIRASLKRYGFKVTVADGGTAGLIALNNSTFDLMIVDIFMPHMRGFESIGVFHDHAPTVRIRILQSDGIQPRLPENGAQAWRDALPAQAIQAHHIARRDRRMPVGGRTAPQICRDSGRRRECSVRATG
jgi:DNA-binding NtrC family response regulator